MHIMKTRNFYEVNMRIHTVKKGESTEDIAREYGINERILKTTNEIARSRYCLPAIMPQAAPGLVT